MTASTGTVRTGEAVLFYRLFGETGKTPLVIVHGQSFSAILGGNVRVGLEDSLFLAKGELARSNADQVRKIRRILDELGLGVATPAEARAMLMTKGADNVAF